MRISNVFSQVTRDRYQLNLRVRSWAHSRAQSVGVYRPSLLASAAAPAKCFTGAQSGANCGISVPAVCVRRYPSQTGSRPSPTSSSVSTIRRRLEVVIPSDRHFSLPAPVLSPRSCASLGIAWSLHTSRLAAFVFPSTASPKAALRRSVVVRSKMVTAVSSRTGEVPGACPHGPSAPVKPNRLYCQLQPNAAVSELSSFVSQLCRIGG